MSVKFSVKNKKTGNLSNALFYTFETLTVLTMLGSILSYFLDKDRALSITLTHIILCSVCLFTLNLPTILQKKYKLYIPPFICIFLYIMLFLNFIVGEIYRVYDYGLFLDRIMHLTSGFMFAFLALSIAGMGHTGTDKGIKLSPLFLVIFTFCFTLTLEFLWEIIEYSVDSFFPARMQRWNDSLIYIYENGALISPSDVTSKSTGFFVHTDPRGSGLVDTMTDMLLTIVGGAIMSIYSFISLKKNPDFFVNKVITKLDNIDVDKEFNKTTNIEVEQDKDTTI